MPISSKIKAGCGAVLVYFGGFLSGVIALIVLFALLIPRSEDWKKPESRTFLANHFSKRLKLTEQQKQALTPGFNQFLERRWQLRKGYTKEEYELLESYFQEIKTELTDEQIVRCEKILDRWWKDKRKRIEEQAALDS